LLEEAGARIVIVEYVHTLPAAEGLTRLSARASLSPYETLRPEAPAKARISDSAALDAIVANPALIERQLRDR
jgi:arsenate reductase-like glutaredoxin family protein